MRISRYVSAHPVEHGWWGLYTPFDHAVCFLPTTTWDRLRSSRFDALNRSDLESLMAGRFLVDDDFDSTSLDRYRANAMTKINAMFLVVTQTCNLACKYCVVENNVRDPRRFKDRMSLTTGKAAVEFFTRLLDCSQPKEARVTFYGGEPMTNQELLLETLPLIRKIQARGLIRPVEAVMITNGTIFDEGVADFFKHHGGAVCVSLDGQAHHHDAARINHAGRGTHATVLENIKRYRDKGLRMGLSCTIGRHNYRHLAEIARFFVAETGIRDIEFQLPYQVPEPGNAFYVPMSEATDYLLEACDVMLDELGVDEYTTLRRLQSFISGHWRHRDCGAVGGQVVVSPNGELGPCHSLVGSGGYFNGNVNDPSYDLFNDPLFAEWSSRIPVNMPQCHGCSFIALCGGGCPYNALTTHGTIWEKDPQVCPYLEKLVPWILRRLWNGQGMGAAHVAELKEVVAG